MASPSAAMPTPSPPHKDVAAEFHLHTEMWPQKFQKLSFPASSPVILPHPKCFTYVSPFIFTATLSDRKLRFRVVKRLA